MTDNEICILHSERKRVHVKAAISLFNPGERCCPGGSTQTKKHSPRTKGGRGTPPLSLLNKSVDPEIFLSVAESANDGILIFDENHRIEFANPMASEITGYSNAELLQMTVSSLLGNPNQFFPEDPFVHPGLEGEKKQSTVQLLTARGTLKEADVSIGLMKNGPGPRRACAFLRDMTESKRLGRKIREVAQQFEKIAELSDDGIMVFDQDFKIIFANQIASEVTGISRKDLIGKNFFTALSKPDEEFLEENLVRGDGIHEKLCTEIEILTPQGEVKRIEVYIVLSKSEAGGLKAYVYMRDITARKKFEKELKASEEKLRNLFERVRHGLFISSKEGKVLDCNPALLDMLEYPVKEEFLNIDIVEDMYVRPQDRKTFQERVEKAGFAKDMEVELKKKGGDKITVLLTGHSIKNERGQIIGYQGIILDISERKRTENYLRDANEFFMNLIESSVDGIIAADMKGNIFIFNRGAETLSGYLAAEVIGKLHITKVYPEGVAQEVMRKLRSPECGGEGKLTPTQLNVVGKTGEEVPIQLSATLIYDGEGKEVASVGIFTDLRPRLMIEKKLQDTHVQLVSSEKMASLGKLAAGIAHEINNPLGGILIYSSLMMEDLPEDDAKRRDLARIVQEAGRCKEIVKSLLEFARQTEPRIEPTDINRAITEGLFFLENQALFHNVRIVKKLDPYLPFVQGNASQLKQVFMNITVNAAEAIHGSGTLTITTFHDILLNRVSVEFADTGEGIPEENLTRIFDPFFTTKDVGKGTGLGLATSYGIVESQGGKISVKSKVGEGTTFTIELLVYPEIQPASKVHPMNETR